MKKEKAKINRSYEKQIKIFGKPLKLKRVMLISIVGILLGITGFLEIKSLVWLVFGVLNGGLFIFTYILQDKSILYFGKKSLESSSAGDLYITIIEGNCPKCNAKLRVQKKGYKAFLICEKNNSHIWESK